MGRLGPEMGYGASPVAGSWRPSKFVRRLRPASKNDGSTGHGCGAGGRPDSRERSNLRLLTLVGLDWRSGAPDSGKLHERVVSHSDSVACGLAIIGSTLVGEDGRSTGIAVE